MQHSATGRLPRVVQPSSRLAQPRNRPIAAAALAGVAYYAGAQVGFAIRFSATPVSLLWPPNALLLAALLLAPVRWWWVCLLAVLPAHLLVELQGGIPLPTLLGLYLTNCGQALLGAAGVRRYAGDPERPFRLESLRQVGAFVILGALLAPFVNAFAATAVIVFTGWGEHYWFTWRTQFLSNVLTVLTLVPAVVTLVGAARVRTAPLRRHAEAGLVGLGLAAASWVGFSGQVGDPRSLPALLYLPLPFLLWAALRFGTAGASLSVLCVTSASIWHAVLGQGPFGTVAPHESALSLELFLISVAVPLLAMAALVQERQQAQTALRDSEARFRALIQHAPDVVAVVDDEDTITYQSPSVERVVGAPARERLGRRGDELLHPDDRAERARLLAEVRRTPGSSATARYRARHRDGTWRVVEATATNLLHEPGVRGIVINWRDITERTRAEQALRESEERYRRLVEASPETVAVLREGRIAYINPAGARLLGARSADELLGRPLLDFVHPDDHGEIAERLRLLTDLGQPTPLVQRQGVRLDGRPIEVETTAVPIVYAGRPAVQAVFRDITERKRHERHLAAQYAVSRILAGDVSLEAAAHRILQTIGAALECDYAGLWAVDERQNLLRCVALRHIAGSTSPEFEAASRELTFVPGAGLLGGVWASAAPASVPRLAADDRFLRGEVAISAGLSSGYWYPLAAGGRLVGVLELFSREARDSDTDAYHVLRAIGGQIGHFIERTRAEDALRASEERYRTTFATAPIGIITVGPGGEIIEANPAFRELLGYGEDELRQARYGDVAHPDDRAEGLRLFDELLSGGRGCYAREVRFRRKGDEPVWTHLTAAAVRDATGALRHTVTMVEDITERKRAEQALQQLTGRLLRLQDEERRRIALELHDATAQNLSAVTMNLARVQQRLAGHQGTVGELLAESRALGEQTLREIRTLSYLLHPPLLDQVGLASALQWYVEGFSTRSGVAVELEVARAIDRLPADVELALFRVVQECLTNVHRHSGSGTARIELAREAGRVVLRVRDRGSGMDVGLAAGAPDDVHTLGVGIPGMRQRLRQLHGRLDIASGPDGTTVSAAVPLAAEDER